jgi:hypothetical protein
MMTKSESIVELSKALAKAQGEIENATKNKTNPHFKSNYADLSAVLGEIRTAFSPNGLSLTQMPFELESGNVGIESMLMHSSGEWIASKVSCKPNKTDAPSLGTVLTYLRRYSASAIAGIAQEDDDGDGAAASNKANPAAGYTVDATATGWINAARKDAKVLNDIKDAAYRAFIKQQAGV